MKKAKEKIARKGSTLTAVGTPRVPRGTFDRREYQRLYMRQYRQRGKNMKGTNES